MKRTSFVSIIPPRGVCFFCLLLCTWGVSAAVPIQEKSLGGLAFAEARVKLLAAAEAYLGTPYRYAGISRNGLDCSGLVYVSFRDALQIAVPRTADAIYAWTERISTAELAPGDLVFFVTAGSKVSHVGIYAGENRFIHSASDGPRTGVMYSRLDESYWKRTYKGAGRALPPDEGSALATAGTYEGNTRPVYSAAGNGAGSGGGEAARSRRLWSDSGFFAGLGAAWTWGGLFEGELSRIHRLSVFAGTGYKWTKYRAALELRPEWDRALEVFRLPLALSFGTDIFRVFTGPAYTFGEPIRGERSGSFYWEAGLSAAIPPIKIGRGAFSLYGELVCRPYHWENGIDFSVKPDLTGNIRVSTGLCYLWHL